MPFFAHIALATAIAAVPIGAATSTFGRVECRGGGAAPACNAQPHYRSEDLAWSGNGFAKPAVAKDRLANVTMHDPAYANDGAYGNGSSWIGASPNSWLKIDLGRTAMVDGIRFGRDRLGAFDDRDPGAFSVWVARTDTYANGNESGDSAEYVKIYDSTTQGFAGTLAGPQTVAVAVPATAARYVKLVFATSGAAIDEIEVSGVSLGVLTQAPTMGAKECRPGAEPPACDAASFDRMADLAWSGNGFARPAVTRDTIPGAPIHVAANLNDGAFGNGSSWIGAGPAAWAKVDLGKAVVVNQVRLGRDRTGAFDDRDPARFEIYVADADATYAMGDDANDGAEYRKVFSSVDLAPDGGVGPSQGLLAGFPKIEARFVKVVALDEGAAIDELEVFGPDAIDASPEELRGLELLSLWNDGWSNHLNPARLLTWAGAAVDVSLLGDGFYTLDPRTGASASVEALQYKGADGARWIARRSGRDFVVLREGDALARTATALEFAAPGGATGKASTWAQVSAADPSMSLCQVAPSTETPGKITLFRDANYAGAPLEVWTEYNRLSDHSYNDSASSVRLEGGATVSIYEDSQFQGKCVFLTQSVPSLGSIGSWGDCASSVQRGASCTARTEMKFRNMALEKVYFRIRYLPDGQFGQKYAITYHEESVTLPMPTNGQFEVQWNLENQWTGKLYVYSTETKGVGPYEVQFYKP